MELGDKIIGVLVLYLSMFWAYGSALLVEEKKEYEKKYGRYYGKEEQTDSKEIQ
jgi:hypothetical protein